MSSSVVLRHREEFEKVLAGYQVGRESKEVLGQIPLVILFGVFGSGRNAIISKLVERGTYHFIVSDTTRPPKVRNGELEQDGVAYHFRKEEDVLSDLKQGAYLEAELIHNQQVSGISVRELVAARASGKIPINEVDIAGTRNVYAIKPDATMIFVIPPSYDVWMQRIMKREVMSDEELENRLQTAERVLQEGLEKDYFSFVVNDVLDDAVEQVDALVRQGSAGESQRARRIAQELLEAIRHR